MLDHIQIKKNKYEMELDERVEELEVEIGDLQSEIDRLFQMSGDNQDAINEINNQITQINSEIDVLKKSIEDINTRVDECDTQIEDIKNEHIRDITSLEEKVMNLNNDLQNYKNEVYNAIKALTDKTVQIDAHLENTDKNVQTNSDNIADLTKQLANKKYVTNVVKINKFALDNSSLSQQLGLIPMQNGQIIYVWVVNGIYIDVDFAGMEQYATLPLVSITARFKGTGRYVVSNAVGKLYKKEGTVSVYRTFFDFMGSSSFSEFIIEELYFTFYGV